MSGNLNGLEGIKPLLIRLEHFQYSSYKPTSQQQIVSTIYYLGLKSNNQK